MDPALPAGLHERSAWLTPERAVTATFALASGVASVPVVACIDGRIAHEYALVIAVCTAGLAAQLARVSLRRPIPSTAIGMALTLGAAFGAVNVGLTLGVISLLNGAWLVAAVGLVLGCLAGLVFGAPIGLAFAAAFAPLLATAVSVRRRFAYDALEPVLLASGAFLALTGAGVAPGNGAGCHACGVALACLGIATACTAFARDVTRRRALRAIRAGRSVGFEVVPATAELDVRGLRSMFQGSHTELDGVLVRGATPAAGSPFRTSAVITPLARVHLSDRDEGSIARRRAAIALAVMAMTAACGIVAHHSSPRHHGQQRSMLSGSWD
jgi:hypothetical protein